MSLSRCQFFGMFDQLAVLERGVEPDQDYKLSSDDRPPACLCELQELESQSRAFVSARDLDGSHSTPLKRLRSFTVVTVGAANGTGAPCVES